MKTINLLLIGTIILFASCSTTKDSVRLTVASEKRTAMGVAPMEVFLVKEGQAPTWSFFYSNIEGFSYEPGYEYVLQVKKEDKELPIPADASSIKYVLVEEVSKIKKTSENMPNNVIEAKYSWIAKVLEVKDANVGVGAAKDKFPVKIVKLEVVDLSKPNVPFTIGDTIHAELTLDGAISPEIGKEYLFEAKSSHPAHALGVYMLETEIKEAVK